MKKIIILLLLYSTVGFSQIVPCVANQMKKYDNKVDSVFLNATADSIIVIDSFSKRTAIAIGSKPFIEKNRFHVDPNGNDNNIGADESPVLTVAKGLTLLGQGDILVVGEGVYSETVSMSLQNTTMSGETGGYASLTQISTINVTTTSGTSNRISDLTVATLNHSGGAPLFLSNTSVSTLINKTSSAYFEAKNSSLQGTSTNTFSAGINYIENSKMGTSIFSGTNTVATLKDVIIDAGDSIVIGAGVIYDIQNVTGKVVISPSAIPIHLALQGQGLSAEYSKAYATNYSNYLAMITPDSVATSANVVVWSNSTKRLEIAKMPVGDTMSFFYRLRQLNDSTIVYDRKNGTSDTLSINIPASTTIDTTSWFYRLRQINDSTVVWDRKDGTSDSLKLGSKCSTTSGVDSVWYSLSGDSMYAQKGSYTYSYAMKKYVDTIYQNTAKDSLFWIKNGVTIGYKIGGGTTVNSATHEVVATAGQTVFTLPHTPISSIAWSFRNGARLPKAAMIVSGSTATYIPSANNNNNLFAGDRIQFDYIY